MPMVPRKPRKVAVKSKSQAKRLAVQMQADDESRILREMAETRANIPSSLRKETNVCLDCRQAKSKCNCSPPRGKEGYFDIQGNVAREMFVDPIQPMCDDVSTRAVMFAFTVICFAAGLGLGWMVWA